MALLWIFLVLLVLIILVATPIYVIATKPATETPPGLVVDNVLGWEVGPTARPVYLQGSAYFIPSVSALTLTKVYSTLVSGTYSIEVIANSNKDYTLQAIGPDGSSPKADVESTPAGDAATTTTVTIPQYLDGSDVTLILTFATDNMDISFLAINVTRIGDAPEPPDEGEDTGTAVITLKQSGETMKAVNTGGTDALFDLSALTASTSDNTAGQPVLVSGDSFLIDHSNSVYIKVAVSTTINGKEITGYRYLPMYAIEDLTS